MAWTCCNLATLSLMMSTRFYYFSLFHMTLLSSIQFRQRCRAYYINLVYIQYNNDDQISFFLCGIYLIMLFFFHHIFIKTMLQSNLLHFFSSHIAYSHNNNDWMKGKMIYALMHMAKILSFSNPIISFDFVKNDRHFRIFLSKC